MSETVLIAEGLRKSYGQLQVLKGVNMEVKAGEVLSIVGASGAGKSTLLHILGTLDKPDSGKIIFKGTQINKLNAQRTAVFRNTHIGFVFQFHNLLPEFTALENICLPGFIGGRDEKEVKLQGTALLRTLGMEKRRNHKPSELSGGEQQRVAVARALINNPTIIFADEPSGNLDSANAEGLHRLFFNLRDEFNKTFVIVTHNNDLAKMSDRKIEIADGTIGYF